MYRRDDLMNPELFSKIDLVDMILQLQQSDRRIFSATVLGSMIQSRLGLSSDPRELVDEAIGLADRLIERLEE